MRKIFLGFLLPLTLTFTPSFALAKEYKSTLDLSQSLDSVEGNNIFYTTTMRLIQQQIYLIARLEQALTSPDANKMRSVGGQLIVHTHSVETFLKRQHPSPKTLCTEKGELSPQSALPLQLTDAQLQIYCSLYASSQELLKLSPVIDRLLSRRGELALVKPLPLVSGERQSDPVISIAPLQRPDLGKPSTPYASREPNLNSSPLPVVGSPAKTAITNYRPSMQPAIAPPEEAITTLKTADQILQTAQAAFPANIKFINPQEDAASLDRFAYDIDSQEKQIYAQFLHLPNTGIFRVLPDSAYRRQPNTLQNRLQPSVSERYPFPSVGDVKGNFIPSLALKMIDDNFQLVPQGINYGFIINIGDIPLEKLDARLQAVNSSTRDFFLNYQPPKELKALQIDRRRLITGKNQNWQQSQIYLSSARAKLNHTYLVRSLQFQLPEIILNRQPISRQNSRIRQQLTEVHSSDNIIAFRAVRRRPDGSYTILWRVLHKLPAPQIEDLENYVIGD
ncbi:hypothetical protein H6G06_10060 [Anabaena sphaerica FACHB-251]|uniref:Uncharacterized protein n=1 Tax=Anabaena sphaerica FACHB-251 TaxID=2692883 RepID=A0A926WFX5_9NOST|nr:hypothetical protein [Anabaena sphaerica]MBD2293829.1 hypothetical protein [Anabaena sphaerica FACHB-251]